MIKNKRRRLKKKKFGQKDKDFYKSQYDKLKKIITRTTKFTPTVKNVVKI